MARWRRNKKRSAPKARSKDEKCATKWCKNRRAFKFTYYRSPKTGKVIRYECFLPHCWKCKARQFKERHPATYVLNAIRNRARQRKIPFTITLEEFRQFCHETGYLEKRGREAHSLSIDRKDHDKGYHIWNICVKSFQENCVNGHVVPGRDCKQNERKPEEYDYDFAGPDDPGDPGQPQPAAREGDPF